MTITVSETISKFIEAKRAQRLSENTLNDYGNTFRKFSKYVGENRDITNIDVSCIEQFLANTRNVSKKTTLNYHTALSSLWRWLVSQGYFENNIVRLVKPPRPEQRDIMPLAKAQIIRILKAAKCSRIPERDIAAILLLLDTGIRASELANAKIKDLSEHDRQLLVFGKGGKERRLKISIETMLAIKTYLAARGCASLKHCREQYLFLNNSKQQFNRHALRQLCTRLEIRASEAHIHPHKFRHTFAIEYLRNGGNIYALQNLLGHTTLDMVKRYIAIAQSDIDRDHDKASPVKALGEQLEDILVKHSSYPQGRGIYLTTLL